MDSVLFRNIGVLVSGAIERPIIETDSVYVEDGIIKEIGTERSAETVVDVRGATLTPALWDAHHHPFFGEYTPRADAFHVMTRTARAGTTCLVSAGSAHQPGMYLPSELLPNVQAHMFRGGLRPDQARSAAGTKALAILSAHCFRFDRPMGVKCYAGTVIAESGLTESDFTEMGREGVQRIKFLRPIPSAEEARQYTQWAHQVGMKVMTHTGGRKLLNDTASIGESLQVLRPDIAAHVNGGPTPPPLEDIDWLVEGTDCALDINFNGNLRLARRICHAVRERNELRRLVIGTDTPSASGVSPGGVIRAVGVLCDITGFPPEHLLCMATGNTARAFGLPGGLVAPGQPADLVVWDAMDGSVTTSLLECLSYGDRPAPGLIMMDGEIVLHGDPRQIDPKRPPVVTRP
jgi:enamidase